VSTEPLTRCIGCGDPGCNNTCARNWGRDATADTQVDLRAVRGTDRPDPEAETERESLVRFPPGCNVRAAEEDIPALEAAERASGNPQPAPAKPQERQAWELFGDKLAELNESSHRVADELAALRADVKGQVGVNAHIANQVTCIRMLERGARETSELEGVVVLVVDDTPEVLDAIRRLLQNMKAVVYYADSEFEARKRLVKIGNGKIDCAILDIVLGDDGLGTDLARHIRRDRPDCGIVFISGYEMQDHEKQAKALGATMLQKPFSIETIREAVLDAATRDV
jgi:CheY-like chemotaxis protein